MNDTVAVRPITDNLLKALQWDDASYAQTIGEQRTALVQKKLIEYAAISMPVRDALSALMSTVDEQAWNRFLFAPRLWQQILGTPIEDTFYLQLCSMLEKELIVYQARKPHGDATMIVSQGSAKKYTWDAMGYYGILQEQGQTISVIKNHLLASDIVLDVSSPNATGHLKDIPGCADNYDAYDQSTLFSLHSRFDEAVSIISQATPTVFDLVGVATRVIVARNYVRASHSGYNSASTNACNGQIVIVNPHLDSVSYEDIADSIVHESIHSMFDCAEPYQPCFPDKRSQIRVCSPWTGNGLDPNTYIQACYTWFGLYTFWVKVLASGLYSSERVMRFIDQARSGLCNQKFIVNALEIEGLYNDIVIVALESIYEKFCSVRV